MSQLQLCKQLAQSSAFLLLTEHRPPIYFCEVDCPNVARLGPEVAGRACLLCPGISDINLLGYGECIVYLDAEVAHRALDFGVSQ